MVKGNFGNGKTHFLNIISRKATDMNFAVSFVPLSKETPFDKLDRIFRRAAVGLRLPGYSQPGFKPLLEVLKPGGEEAEGILNYARRNLHPKIEAVLKNYLESSGDAYNQHILASDLAGDFIPNTQLKSIHRLNFGRALSMPPFKVKENTFDYFRFLSHLIRICGYAGWVILFDEFEQLMYLGITAKTNAYLNAARFMSHSFGLKATYAVFSASSNLWSELIWKQKNSDYDIVPQRLAAKERHHDIPTVREVFGCFLKDNLFLDTLSTFDIHRMIQAVRDHHAHAYGW
ncbi:MAG: BREX system ATP-binding domain-containing protein [Bacillota bacterium]